MGFGLIPDLVLGFRQQGRTAFLFDPKDLRQGAHSIELAVLRGEHPGNGKHRRTGHFQYSDPSHAYDFESQAKAPNAAFMRLAASRNCASEAA